MSLRPCPVLLIVLPAAVVGCGQGAAPTAKNAPVGAVGGPAPLAPAGSLRMLNLGDSYTIGEGVAVPDRWPNQLAAVMSGKGTPLDVNIIARTGWTTANLAAAIEKENLTPPYDLVTLLIGVNNQYQGRSLDEYHTEFTALLKKAIALAGDRADRVVVLSIPDYSPTPFGRKGKKGPATVAKELDQFNEVNKDETTKAGARYVEITKKSRDQAADPAMLVADGLHPSAAMYKTWVDAALPEVEAALGQEKK
jgi:lysophospholipase L1-like esterase